LLVAKLREEGCFLRQHEHSSTAPAATLLKIPTGFRQPAQRCSPKQRSAASYVGFVVESDTYLEEVAASHFAQSLNTNSLRHSLPPTKSPDSPIESVSKQKTGISKLIQICVVRQDRAKPRSAARLKLQRSSARKSRWRLLTTSPISTSVATLSQSNDRPPWRLGATTRWLGYCRSVDATGCHWRYLASARKTPQQGEEKNRRQWQTKPFAEETLSTSVSLAGHSHTEAIPDACLTASAELRSKDLVSARVRHEKFEKWTNGTDSQRSVRSPPGLPAHFAPLTDSSSPRHPAILCALCVLCG
jgi:hypothetical protein